jgi:hypothetical protein
MESKRGSKVLWLRIAEAIVAIAALNLLLWVLKQGL